MCGLQVFCFISHSMSIYKFYVIFLSFCFVYKFFMQFTTQTLIYPFFHQFTSFMCCLQIFCFISHLMSIYKLCVILLSFCFVYTFFFNSHLMSIYKFYVIFLSCCLLEKNQFVKKLSESISYNI